MRNILTGILLLTAALAAVPGCSAGNRNAHSRIAGFTVEETTGILEAHNRLRREVGVAPLAWSADLAEFAGAWALHLAESGGRIRHRPETGKWARRHGENIFKGAIGFFSPVQAVEAWAVEKTRYRGEAIDWSNFHGFGHYTQVVWRDTARVGCSAAEGGGDLIVVCNYDPPGNVVGQRPY